MARRLTFTLFALALAASLSLATAAHAGYKGFANPNAVISVQELKDTNNVVVVDYSGKAKEFIPGAIFIDRGKLLPTVNGVKMMQAGKETFEKVLGEYGITASTKLAVYSDNDNKFAARFYIDMKSLGHDNVRLIDGSIVAWKKAGLPTVKKPATLAPAKYVARYYIKHGDINLVKKATKNPDYCIVDTRTAKEYKKGRIPSATDIDYKLVLNDDMTFKTASELKELYKEVPADKELITYCLGGIRAAHSWFVLSELMGYKHVTMYDGSWWDYEKTDSPIEK